MTKEQLINTVFENKKELDIALKSFYGFTDPLQEELDIWNYKTPLNISLSFLVGLKTDRGFLIESVVNKKFRGKWVVQIKMSNGSYERLSNCKVLYYDKFLSEERCLSLHPTRGGKNLYEFGHPLREKEYKSLYYITKEYRKRYEKTLNNNLGTEGLTSPVQSPVIKRKIANVMNEKYGYNSFLNRGPHYSAITESMISKYGVENLFYCDEWQSKNRTNFSGGVSNFEIKVVNEIIKIPKLRNSKYFGSGNSQASFLDSKINKSYRVDFFNDKNKLVVEAHGDYWHCNPDMYGPEFYHEHKKKKAKEIWEEDKNRIKLIEEEYGCKYYTVWERDWKNDQEKIIKELKKFLDE